MNRIQPWILSLALSACADPGGVAGDEPAELALEGQPTAEPDGLEDIAADAIAALGDVGATLFAEPRFTRYIALGDSFSSGNGAFGGWYPCYRTEGAWPVLLSTPLEVSRFEHVACSGSTAVEVIKDQLPKLQGADAKTLITITVGGNDSGFGSWFGTKCVFGRCQDDQQTVEDGLQKARANLTDLFPRLRAAAPLSTIVAVGYPHYVEEEDCGLTISKAESTLIRSGIDSMNALIEELAAENGISAITTEVTDEFRTHGLCGAETYLNVFTAELGASYHPNVEGNKAYLRAVKRGLSIAP